MSNSVISTFNNIGLINIVDGDDSKLKNIQEAANLLVDKLKADKSLLIPYVLAGLNVNVDANDVSINDSEQALLSIWQTANSYYGSDKPINIYRMILLDACNQMVIEDNSNAYILWNTVADIYTSLKFGNEKTFIEEMINYWLKTSESFVAAYIENSDLEDIELIPKTRKKAFPEFALDKDDFQKKMFLSMGSVDAEGVAFTAEQAFNQYAPSQGNLWIKDFIVKFSKIYEQHINDLNKVANEIHKQAVQISNEKEEIYNRNSEKLVSNHNQVISKIRLQNNLKFESLWWSQTMYSPLLKESYRNMDINIANLAMVKDLLSFVDNVAPDSFSYLLLEVNAKLLTAEQNSKISLIEFFEIFRSLSQTIPEPLKCNIKDISINKSLNIDDIIKLAISSESLQLSEIRSKLISVEIQATLPQLAQALFRQELAKKFISMEL
ncbi:hypothetical protein GCM10010099_24240 [Streptomyces cinereus]|nr:hypothetical protein GCM10010099_24240 [Streptomyces cinereus]